MAPLRDREVLQCQGLARLRCPLAPPRTGAVTRPLDQPAPLSGQPCAPYPSPNRRTAVDRTLIQEILEVVEQAAIASAELTGRGKQDEVLLDYCERVYPEAKSDLAILAEN